MIKFFNRKEKKRLLLGIYEQDGWISVEPPRGSECPLAASLELPVLSSVENHINYLKMRHPNICNVELCNEQP